MRLRLVSNCMSLPCSLFYPVFNETTTFNRNFHLSPLPIFFPSLHLLGVANLYTVFFLCHPTLPTHLFLPLTPAPHPPPPPFLDITECRSENKKTSRASGTKVHIHIINLRFVKKTIETRKKNKPTRFFVFFFCMSPTAYSPYSLLLSSISRDPRGRPKVRSYVWRTRIRFIFYHTKGRIYIYICIIHIYILHVRMNPLCRS